MISRCPLLNRPSSQSLIVVYLYFQSISLASHFTLTVGFPVLDRRMHRTQQRERTASHVTPTPSAKTSRAQGCRAALLPSSEERHSHAL
ncbi:hypothetical protein SKAU_G00061920 [Synaphobranchus kaupii]|uniref:Uncharacterized protein n=1 Tax=Synaphobranchus kaupii TaxID=118154 RepID=A0A9Q1G624_SYNKA|nr:hypothetical protein SKAU_G00061920 [Synaphobranchus kaupii]